jgi:hypothetical protein
MDVIEALGSPGAVTIQMIKDKAAPQFNESGVMIENESELHLWFCDSRNIKQYSRRMENCGYMQVGNEAAKDGYWKVGGKRMAVYAKKELPLREQLKEINVLCSKFEPK